MWKRSLLLSGFFVYILRSEESDYYKRFVCFGLGNRKMYRKLRQEARSIHIHKHRVGEAPS